MTMLDYAGRIKPIVERLRQAAQEGREIITAWDHDPNLYDEAADEIASLTAEVMHLRDKLDKIAECARWNLEPKDQYPNQNPTAVGCVCGWWGETTALVESMGTHILHCPKCYRAVDG